MKESGSIPVIFNEKGEHYFREVESETLREWAGSDKSFVMATGGGAPCFHSGMEVINSTGLSVFLDVPVQELLRRLRNDQNRPLLNSSDIKEREQRLTALYNSRLKTYSLAKIKLSNPTAKSTLEALHLKM
jgi:shikimate kinase